jgi:prepilin-type N-terminal cleavage/methylation domain-containing protein/prepilin-type processing-associated H-X9-DG protein
MVLRVRLSGRAFTLVELLVVIAIIGILISLLVPVIASAIGIAHNTACQNNLHQIGVAIRQYASHSNGCIPFGPKAPPMMTATDFYPSTGAPTSLISLMNGKPVGLGLILKYELSQEPKALFCPGSDQSVNADAELANVGVRQAQCSYYYRHASVDRQYDTGSNVMSPGHIDLSSLGLNRNGKRIRALVIDSQFLVPSGFGVFGITSRTHHQQKCANVLYSDGHVASLDNTDGRFTVNLDNYQALTHAFDRILSVLETADEE